MSNKTGFIYYNIDTDRYQDIRIKRLKKEFGCNGIAVYDYILCEVYRVKGCFLKWDDAILFDISEYFNLPESTVLGVVNYCCLVGLFEKLSFEKMIITSQSIQKRFIEMSIRAKRKDVKLPEECSIIPEKPPKLPEGDGGNSGSFKQSRVEESKVEESKENNVAAIAAALNEKKTGFIEELKKYSQKYGGKYRSEMVTEFYQYWSELNPSKTKMRFQLQKTWETNRRLGTWARREKIKSKINGTEKLGTSEGRIEGVKQVDLARYIQPHHS